MVTEPTTVVQRLWNYCNVLRDDGVSYGDYVEQLTYLLFLKIADEQQQSAIPIEHSWSSLQNQPGDALAQHYRTILSALAQGSGLISLIFQSAQNRIRDPAKLRRLIELIDRENWTGLGIDLTAEIYEGLLEKNAQDTKSGAGQYFTPRPLVKAIVEVMRPEPGQTICDPACGTGGFLVAAHDYIVKHYKLKPEGRYHLDHRALHGWEIVANTARLCAMNLYLHGVHADQSDLTIRLKDALAADPGDRFDMVLTNPPFGKKSSVTYATEENTSRQRLQTVVRDDFWTSTRNKQLNFLQHVKTILKHNGRAAVVVPDNVLFEGGAGEIIRRKLLGECDLHTLLRLPTGIFYAPGVKANVLFFDRKRTGDAPHTQTLWIYDLRTNHSFTLKQRPLTGADLEEFIACFDPGNRHQRVPTWSSSNPQGRWRAFPYCELMARDKANLDIVWLQDDSLENTANLPEPDVLASQILDDLETALEDFRAITEALREQTAGQQKGD